MLLESLEARCLLTIYGPIGGVLAPSPVEGTAFAGALVGTFASTDAMAGLSATINWGPSATPTASVGTISLIGSVFVPGVGSVPQYGVTGGTTYPEETRGGSQPIVVTVSDSVDGTDGIITASTTVDDAPMTTTGGIASASVTEGARVNYTGAIALMTFTDGNPNSTAAEFSAAIDWGDGSPSSVGTVTKSGATYTVSGAHAYPRRTSSPNILAVKVTDVGGSTATHTTSITVTDAALSGPTAIPVPAAEGQPLVNVPLGTFLDGNPSATAADFAVSINWGDGTTNDPGVATLVGGSTSNAKFAVTGSHVYASAAGSPYAVTVSVTDSGGATTTINTAATVSQTPLAVAVGSLLGGVGSPTSPQVVATFFDAGGADPLGNYSATLSWGDGTTDTTAGGLSIAAVAGQPGRFAVSAPAHGYAAPGFYPLTVTVDDSDPTSGMATGFARIAPASLAVSAVPGGSIDNVVEGQPLPPGTVIATFVSGDPNATIGDFTADIDWGDGSPMTAGFISRPGGNVGPFVVAGIHTYTHAHISGYLASVRVADAFGTTGSVNSVIDTVADAPLSSPVGIPILAAEGQTLVNVPLGTYLDGNPFAAAADFAATIDWGDGTVGDPGSVTLVGGSAGGARFAVTGTHAYATTPAIPYTVTVNVADVGGMFTIIGTTATLTRSPLAVTVDPVLATAGLPTASQVVGGFFDAGGAHPSSSYAARLTWGDASTDPLNVVALPGQPGRFVLVAPPHRFAAPGFYPMSIDVDQAGTTSGAATGFARVTAASLIVSPAAPGQILGVVEGLPLPASTTVASFISGDASASAGGFSATIDWGDGTPSTLGTFAQPGGVGTPFLVLGGHTYAHATSTGYAVTVRVADAFGTGATATTQVLGVADAPLSAPVAVPVQAAEGQTLVSVPLITFLDGNPLATAADFDITLDWGDGSPLDVGYVARVGTADGEARFLVTGTHAYASAAGGPYTIRVNVADAGGAGVQINTAATVSRTPLAVTVGTVLATAALPTASQVVGGFFDAGGAHSAASYSATLSWGDGSSNALGLVPVDGQPGRFDLVAPAHNYASPGFYPLSIAVDQAGTAGGGATGFARVSAASLVAAPSPLALIQGAVEGRPLPDATPVAAFFSGDPNAAVGGFSATIDWGDGTPATPGTIAQPGGVGTSFVVLGGHTYAHATATGHAINVRVADAFGSSSSATTQVPRVDDAPLTTGTALPVAAAVHKPLLSVPVATFLDTNPGATAGDFAATIDWGDATGPDANAQVVRVGGTPAGAIFAVYGSHTYASAGAYPIVAVVVDAGGQSLAIAPSVANATVAASSLSVSVPPQAIAEGASIPAGAVIGTFTDANGPDPVGLYTATIRWGDGSAADLAATITPIGGGGFRVTTNLGHAYPVHGTYALGLSVQGASASGLGGGLVVVNAPSVTPPVLTPGFPIATAEGTPLAGLTVASFTDVTPGVTAASYHATIDWGDGGPTSTGIVTPGLAPGSFALGGTHTYDEAGAYVVVITLDGPGGGHAATMSSATVADAPLSAPTGVAATAAQDVPLVSLPLGSFVDANRRANPRDFAATIDWGDGTPPTPGVVSLAGGTAAGARFDVAGGHTYAAPGSFAVTVRVDDVGGSTTTLAAQATVRPSLVALSVGNPVAATEGIATPANLVVATFGVGASLAPPSAFAATVDWGDGSPAVAATVAANGAGYGVLAPAHAYADQGTYVLRVVVTEPGRPSVAATAASFAVVADAPLSAVAAPGVAATERVALTDAVVGAFRDANPAATADDFLATIAWGDGTAGLGTVSQPGGPGTAFVVRGGHTYADSLADGPGAFPIAVVVQDEGGQRLTLANTAAVADAPLPLAAALDPADDHGASHADGVTNDNTPSYLGTSDPGATIRLYATSAAGTILAGQAVAGADGHFAVQITTPLADGTYTMSLGATDASGHTTSAATLAPPLVIDTVGPKVTGVQFDRVNGRVIVTVRDDRAGLDQSSLLDGANYQFRAAATSRRTPRPTYTVTSLAATPAGPPTEARTLAISLNQARYIPGGRYLLTINSADGSGSHAHDGLRDLAGNALDGEFYGEFASGNNKPGGDFVAGLDAALRTIFAPTPARAGYATPNPRPGTPAAGRKIRAVVPPKHVVQIAQHRPQGALAATLTARPRSR